jgi:hypothetical protein
MTKLGITLAGLLIGATIALAAPSLLPLCGFP